MSRPRFNKLPAKKRERILEAAAKAFASHGYDNASLNRILDEAGISKGAAYYYFDDKADLYATTVHHYSHELMSDINPSEFTAESFWDELTEVYRHQFTNNADRPWVFGIVKAGGTRSMEMLTEGPLADLWQRAQLLLVQLLRRGRELGVIRTDVPEDLLLSWIMAIDVAHDRWLFSRWAELEPEDMERAAERIGETLRRLLEPRQAQERETQSQ